jgi:hypothetical protein
MESTTKSQKKSIKLTKLYEQLQRDAKQRLKKIKNKTPMKGSKWWKELAPYTNLKEEDRKGELMRCTLFSGGTLCCSKQTYFDVLHLKAKDIDSDVIVTDNELVYNSELYHLYLEVDWKDKTCLPTIHQIKNYMECLQNLLRDCFPDAMDYHIDCLQNFPYIKEKNSEIFLATGLHLITKIVTRTLDNFAVAGTLDKRLIDVEPIWVGRTDLTSYHDANGNLRPAFSFKMPPCPTCHFEEKQNKSNAKKNNQGKEDNEDDDEEEDVENKKRRRRQEFEDSNISIDGPKPKKRRTRKKVSSDDSLLSSCTLSCTDCFRGKVIDPNYYNLKYQMTHDGEFKIVEPCEYTTLEIITNTSLFLQIPRDCDNLIRPADMGSILDLQTEKFTPNTLKNKKGIILTETQFHGTIKFLSDLVCRMISMFDPDYAHVVAKDPKQGRTVRGGQSDIMIFLKGKGSRFCLRKKEVHGGNHVYYILSPSGMLTFQCHASECKEFLIRSKQNKTKNLQLIQIKLTYEERMQAKKIFGFGSYIPSCSELTKDFNPNIEHLQAESCLYTKGKIDLEKFALSSKKNSGPDEDVFHVNDDEFCSLEF